MVLSDAHKYPFSLFSESKDASSGAKVEREGNVTDAMDKSIGRAVIKIKGAVSANNYIDFSNLQLEGQHVCIQLCMMKSNIATIHIELQTSRSISLRVTISTLYDVPRFLGRSLRLPLPVKTGWVNVHMDMNEMLRLYCPMQGSQSKDSFKCIRRVQLCSNLIVRDLVTSNQPLISYKMPVKDLAVVSNAAARVQNMNITVENYHHSTPSSRDASNGDEVSPVKSALATTSSPMDTVFTYREIAEQDSVKYSQENAESNSSNRPSQRDLKINKRSVSDVSGQSVGRESPVKSPIASVSANGSMKLRSPMGSRSGSRIESVVTPHKSGGRNVKDIDTPDLIKMEGTSPATVADDTECSSRYKHKATTQPSRSRLYTPKLTPHRVTKSDKSVKASSYGKSTPVTSTIPSERVISMDRALGYSGGPAVLLYNGEMMAMASGCVIVLLDVRAKEVSNPRDQTYQQESGNLKKKEKYSIGLWKAFKPSVISGVYEAENYPQAYLKGHSNSITIIEVSLDGRLMATCESGEKARVFIWDLQEGKRIAVLQPHAESVHTICFNLESTMLCTSGWDHVRREQIVVWDVATLVQVSSGTSSSARKTSASSSLVVARQLSDFHISKLMFSPFQELSLVSCGRENIRFWRVKKGHLPGRPVQLNEFSRGYLFTDVAYVNLPPVGSEVNDALLPCVLVSSSMGLLLRVDCGLEQVVCAYTLHNGPIRSLSVNAGYCVTGGDDCRMRIWPLHFTDFLMEAHHEAPVTHTSVSHDLKLLSVGTASGTLGILDVTDHRYWTVLRSHVGAVVATSVRPPLGEEFMTLGADNTVRLWDCLSGQQKFEFDSPHDIPLCGVYHPNKHILSCGFSSGTMRVFDVQTTSTLYERSEQPQLSSAIVRVLYSHTTFSTSNSTQLCQLRLYTLSLRGRLTVYDVNDNYTPIRSITLTGNPWETAGSDVSLLRHAASLHMSCSQDGRLLAVSCGSVYSLCVFDAAEMVPVYKGSSLYSGTSPRADLTATYMGTTQQSSATHMNAKAASNVPLLGNVSSVINGLLFCADEDRSNTENTDGHVLLIVTDKRFISIDITVQNMPANTPAAVLESAYANSLCADDVSSRRIEGGMQPVSGSITRDHTSGLVFMGVNRAPKLLSETSKMGTKSNTLVPVVGDALAIVGISFRRVVDSHRFRPCHAMHTTPMQVITELPGDKHILSISQCGPASNRLIVTDSSGCVCVWHMKEDRIGRLKDKAYGIDQENDDIFTPDEATYGLNDLNKDDNALQNEVKVSHDGNETINLKDQFESEFETGDTCHSNSKLAASFKHTSDATLSNAQLSSSMADMYCDSDEGTSDDKGSFDIETLTVDPLRPQEYSESITNSKYLQRSEVEDEKQSGTSSSTVTWKQSVKSKGFKTSDSRVSGKSTTKTTLGDKVICQARKSTISSREKLSIKKSSVTSNSRASSKITEKDALKALPVSPVSSAPVNASFGSNTEYVGKQMESVNYSSHSIDEGYGSDSDNGSKTESEDKPPGLVQELPSYEISAAVLPARVLAQKISTKPSFSPATRSLLTTNGNEMSIENIDSRSGFAVLSPPATSTGSLDCSNILSESHVQHIQAASLSPSGLFVAAIVAYSSAKNNTSNTVPVQSSTTTGKASELHVWSCSNVDEEESGCVWRHLGVVALHTSSVDSSAAGPTMNWSFDDCLVLLVPVPLPSQGDNAHRDTENAPSARHLHQSGALLSITKWASEMSFDESISPSHTGNICKSIPHIDMPGLPLVIPFTCQVDGVIVLPEWYGAGDCGVVVYGGSKISLFGVYTMGSEVHRDGVKPSVPLWISDAGSSGPFLSLHLAEYTHTHTMSSSHSTNTSLRYGTIGTAVSTHTSDAIGHSYSESLTGCHYAGTDERVYDMRTTRRSQAMHKSKNSFKYSSSSRVKETDNLGYSSCGCTDVVSHTFPLLVALDSLGSVQCCRLTVDESGDSTCVSCIAKVAASHISGAPRTLALSSSGTVLVMGSNSSLQVFLVTVKDSPGTPFSVSLTLHHKVVSSFPLDNAIFTLTPNIPNIGSHSTLGVSNVATKEKAYKRKPQPIDMELLITSSQGDIGLYTSTSKAYDRPKVNVLRSPPPYIRKVDICTIYPSDSNTMTPIVYVLDKKSGSVGLVDATTGRKASCPENIGIHSCTCIAAYDTILATGSQCGRVAIYNAVTMTLLHVTSFPSKHTTHNISAAPSKSRPAAKSPPILSLNFLYGGKLLAVLRADKMLYMLPTSDFNAFRAPVGVELAESVDEYNIVPIYGDSSLCALCRGHTMYMYSTKLKHHSHPILIGLYKLTTQCFGYNTQPRESDDMRLTAKQRMNAAQLTYPIHIQALYISRPTMQFGESVLNLTAVGTLHSMGFKSTQSFVCTAALDLSQNVLSESPHTKEEIPMYTIFHLPSQLFTYSQNKHVLGLLCSCGVYILDPHALHLSASQVRMGILEEYSRDQCDDDDVWIHVQSKEKVRRSLFCHKDILAASLRGTFQGCVSNLNSLSFSPQSRIALPSHTHNHGLDTEECMASYVYVPTGESATLYQLLLSSL